MDFGGKITWDAFLIFLFLCVLFIPIELIHDLNDAEEDLADDIEFVIESLNTGSSAASFEVIDARVTSTETDEGLMTPFGVVIINGLIRYQQDAAV